MGSALLNTPQLDAAPIEQAAPSQACASNSPDALRSQVAARLAAHRNRRNQLYPQPSALSAQPAVATTRTARIAATVAEHYSQALSYRAFLAAEAERATQQAQAAAEIAALNAQAVAQAEQKLLEDLYPSGQHESPEPLHSELHEEAAEKLSLWPDFKLDSATDPEGPCSSVPSEGVKHRAVARTSSPTSRAARIIPRQSPNPEASGLTVRPFADVAACVTLPPTLNPSYGARQRPHLDDAEARALDEEITFRQAPVFEEPAGPPMPLAANLIEFPRQLVAPRKVRPRHAEGPLRDDDDIVPGGSQLRIFEVDAAQISTVPDIEETPAPQWTSLWLDAPKSAPGTAKGASSSGEPIAALAIGDPLLAPYANVPPSRYPAALSCRIKAAAIDTGIILSGFLAATATVAAVALHATQGGDRIQQLLAFSGESLKGRATLEPIALLAAIATGLVFLYLLYHVLFFTLSDATPGMRIARIALCTFADDNPTRHAMRCRIPAVLLSACPLGLGFFWAALDKDRLAWHDLITRMYQRSY